MRTQWAKIIQLDKEFRKRDRFQHASDLYSRLGFAKATFYRLIDKMQTNLKAPIIHNRKLGYKYDPEMKDRFELPGIWFSEEELHSLLLLGGLTTSLKNGFFDKALEPLNECIDSLLEAQDIKKRAWIEKVKIISIAFRDQKPEIFKIVTDALLHEKKLSILYWKFGNDNDTERLVSPQTILRYRDNWYLDAYCHRDEKLKTFSINRIENANVVNEPSKSIERNTLDTYFGASYGIFSGNNIKTAVVHFKEYAAFEVAQENWYPEQKLEKLECGKIRLEIPYSHSKELLMDVLRWGDQAEIISPVELREEIAEIIKNTSQIYKT